MNIPEKDKRPFDDHWHAGPDEREEKPPRDYIEYVLNLCRATKPKP